MTMKQIIQGHLDEIGRGAAMIATGVSGLTVSDIVAEHWMKMAVGAVTIVALLIQAALAVMKYKRGDE
jgi:hypothetical protein